MLLTTILRILSVIVFAYLTWRKMKDDLGEDTSSFLWSCLVAFLVGGRVGYAFINLLGWQSSLWDWIAFWDKPGFNLLLGFVLMMAYVFLFSLFDRWSFVEIAEDLLFPSIFGAILWIAPEMFNLQIINKIVPSILLILYLVSFLGRRYRSFYWYKSGRKGFLFLFSGLVFSILISIISYFIKVSVYYRYLGFASSLIFLIGLAILGEIFNSSKNK